MQNLQYPVGKFIAPTAFSTTLLDNYISTIQSFPDKIIAATSNLTEQQLDTPYRPDGWTVRQVVHHCADSHMNSIIRLKLALTEDKPTIKAYNESAWAKMADSITF
ncbi:MAG TPA: DinB family protein, partial [Chitinophagales bacterium]|nr:DinB family protein [Chitinophagales bacterium]